MNRGKLELWLNKHNHKMELARTVGSLFGIIGAVTGVIILLKMYGVIP